MEEKEKSVLINYSQEFDAKEELNFACDFVKQDILSAFTRSTETVKNLLVLEPKEVKLNIMNLIWDTTKNKGYITALEAQFLLKIAKELKIETELINLVREAS